MNVVMPPRKSRRIASHLKTTVISQVESPFLKTDGPLIGDCQVRRSVLKVDIVLVVSNEAIDFAVTADSGQARERL